MAKQAPDSSDNSQTLDKIRSKLYIVRSKRTFSGQIVMYYLPFSQSVRTLSDCYREHCNYHIFVTLILVKLTF